MSRRSTGFLRSAFGLTAIVLLAGLYKPRNRPGSSGGSDSDAGGGRPRTNHAGSDAPVGQQQSSLTATATGPTARPGTGGGDGSTPGGRPSREELQAQHPDRRYDDDLPDGWYRDKNGRVHDEDGWFAPDPNVTDRGHNRDTEYPGSFSTETHDRMAAEWTDEGMLLNDGHPVSITRGDPPSTVPLSMNDRGVIVDPTGRRVPRDELTWRDNSDANNGFGNVIPYYDENGRTNLTYDHDRPVVQHWVEEGHTMSYQERQEWYNNNHNLVPMGRAENSSDGATLPWNYSDVAPDRGNGYTSRYD